MCLGLIQFCAHQCLHLKSNIVESGEFEMNATKIASNYWKAQTTWVIGVEHMIIYIVWYIVLIYAMYVTLY
jgi:hypothetical protein